MTDTINDLRFIEASGTSQNYDPGTNSANAESNPPMNSKLSRNRRRRDAQRATKRSIKAGIPPINFYALAHCEFCASGQQCWAQMSGCCSFSNVVKKSNPPLHNAIYTTFCEIMNANRTPEEMWESIGLFIQKPEHKHLQSLYSSLDKIITDREEFKWTPESGNVPESFSLFNVAKGAEGTMDKLKSALSSVSVNHQISWDEGFFGKIKQLITDPSLYIIGIIVLLMCMYCDTRAFHTVLAIALAYGAYKCFLSMDEIAECMTLFDLAEMEEESDGNMPESAEDHAVVPVMGLMIYRLLNVDVKDKLPAFIKSLGDLPRATSGVSSLMTYSLKACTKLLYWLRDMGIPVNPGWTSSDVSVDDFRHDANNLLNRISKGEHVSFSLAQEFGSLIARGRDLSSGFTDSSTKEQRALVNETIRSLTQLENRIASSGIYGSGPRIEPIGLMLVGTPGAGKTTIVHSLIDAFMATVLEERVFEQYYENPHEWKYNYVIEQSHHNGFHNQDIILFDDIGQKRDVPGEVNNEYNACIRLNNFNEFMVNGAALENKGSQFFTPRMVAATSNIMRFDHRIVKSIMCPNAFTRRFKYSFIASPTKASSTAQTADLPWRSRMIDPTMGLGLPENFEFRKHNLDTGASSSECYTFDQVVKLLVFGSVRTEVIGKEIFENSKATMLTTRLRKIEALVEEKEQQARDCPKDNEALSDEYEKELFAARELLKQFKIKYKLQDKKVEPLNIKGLPSLQTRYDSEDTDDTPVTGESDEREEEFWVTLNGRREKVKKIKKTKFFQTPLNKPEAFSIPRSMIPPALTSLYDKHVDSLSFDNLEVKLINDENPPVLLTEPEWKPIKPVSPEKVLAFKGDNWAADAYPKLPKAYQIALCLEYKTKLDYLRGMGYRRLIIRDMLEETERNVETKSVDLIAATKTLFSTGWKEICSPRSKIILGIITLSGVASLYLTSTFIWDRLFPKRYRGSPQSGSGGDYPTKQTHARRGPDRTGRLKLEEVNLRWLKPEFDHQQQDTDVAKRIARGNQYGLWVGDYYLGTITFMCGTIAIMPYHFCVVMDNYLNADPALRQSSSCIKLRGVVGRDVEHKFSYHHLHIKKMPGGNDLAFVNFGCDTFKSHRNITKFVKPLTPDMRLKGMLCKPGPTELVTTSIPFKTEYACNSADYFIAQGYRYALKGGPGTCGALLYLHTGHTPILCGMHVSGNTSDVSGLSIALTPEIVEAIRDWHDELKQVKNEVDPVGPIPDQLFPECNSLYYAKQPYTSTESKIIPSCHYGRLAEPKTKPCHLKPFETPSGELINPMKKARNKFFSPNPGVDTHLLDIVCDKLSSQLTTAYVEQPWDPRLWTFKEAVAGYDGMRYFDGIKRSTSAGYPWNTMNLPGSGKSCFFGSDGPYTFEGKYYSELKQQVDHIIAEAKKGIRPNMIYTSNLKDECKPIDKVDIGKTRQFAASPLALTIVTRMYFGDFNRFCMSNRIRNGMTVAMNYYSEEWGHMASLLKGNSSEERCMIFGDYKFWEACHAMVYQYRALRIMQDYYYNSTEEDVLVRKVLFEEVTNSYHISEGVVYEIDGCNPSGGFLTMLVNCIINLLVSKTAFTMVELGDSDYNTFDIVQALERVTSATVSMVHGDDNGHSVNTHILTDCTPRAFADALSRLGFTYTAEDKGVLGDDFKKLEECSFLKRGFVFDKRHCRWIGPLSLDTILESPMWTKKGLNPSDVFDNLFGMYRELSLHPDAIFKKYAPLFEAEARRNYPEMFPYTNKDALRVMTFGLDVMYA